MERLAKSKNGITKNLKLLKSLNTQKRLRRYLSQETSVLYEVGDYTESGEATLRQIKGMRKDDVIGICEIHGLDTEGTKAQLIERIKKTLPRKGTFIVCLNLADMRKHE